MSQDNFDAIIREYIDFINLQGVAYMDACSGFAGNKRVIERQVARISRPKGFRINEKGQPIIMRVSYEDPSMPDVIHQRIIRSDEYIKKNAEGGIHEQQICRAIIIFLYTHWEDEIRPRLATARKVSKNDIKSDLMGDLRELRHAVLHAKGILKLDRYKKLKKLKDVFEPDKTLMITYNHMHKIFVMAKQDAAELLFDYLGIDSSEELSQDIKDFAISHNK